MSDEDLPEGWAVVPLEVLVEHILGGDWGVDVSDRKPGWSRAKVIRGTDFKNWASQRGAKAPTRTIKDSSLQKRRLKPGDIVLEVSGGGPDQPVGRSLLVDESTLSGSSEPFVCSNFCRQVRLKSGVDSALVNLFLRWQYAQGGLDRFQNQTTNLRNLQVPELLAGMMVLLPPITEQKRISAKVEELLARVNAAREHLARVPAILKRFRQAVLASAYDGRLTEEWRTQSNLATECTWPISRIADVCSVIVDCPHSTPTWVDHGEVCLRTTNFTKAGLDLTERRYVAASTYRQRVARLEPRSGDVVYSREGGILGIACVIPPRLRACLGQRMMLMRPDAKCVVPDFLCNALNSPAVVDVVTELTGGSASPHLNVGDIRRFAVPLPSLVEQQEIVRRVEALFSLADTIEKRVAAATARAEKLTQAILAKAFRGELVPTEAELARRDGRTYESASVLLERIRPESAGADTRTDRRQRRAGPEGEARRARAQVRRGV